MNRDRHVVSVVIPTIGRASLTQCQEALAKQTRPPDEVIVVHDVERRGPAWARNEGIRRSRGDLIAFTDDDCMPPAEWLEQLIHAVDRFDAAGAGGTFIEADPFLRELRQRRDQRRCLTIPAAIQTDTAGLVGSGGSILYRRDWLEACAREDGYVFNETFRIAQDWELALRLRRRGAAFAFIPARVRHLRSLGARGFLRQQFGRGAGIAMLFTQQQAGGVPVGMHRSLLWDESGGAAKPRWAQAVWQKLIGPFDRDSFSRARYFWLFWLGEKFQGVGFMWGLLTVR